MKTLKRTTVAKTEKIRHENAVIINLSGHKIVQSVFDNLKEEGHKYFHIFPGYVHIDPDQSVYDQCHTAITTLITRKNANDQTLLETEGETYYLSCGHSQANTIIYNGLSALLGYNPAMIITGLNKYKFQEYECKQIMDVQAWAGRWRSIERQKYL